MVVKERIKMAARRFLDIVDTSGEEIVSKLREGFTPSQTTESES